MAAGNWLANPGDSDDESGPSVQAGRVQIEATDYPSTGPELGIANNHRLWAILARIDSRSNDRHQDCHSKRKRRISPSFANSISCS